MPEGPEVYNMCFQLTMMKDKTLTNIEYKDTRYNFDSLIGQSITDVNSYGKILWLEFNHNMYLLFRFGLHGQLVAQDLSYIKFTLIFAHEYINYGNRSNIGSSVQLLNKQQRDAILNTLGISLYSIINDINTYDITWFTTLIKKSNTPIATFLLNQKYIAGIGNYLKSDILYTANINPYIKTSTLNTSQILALYHAIYTISKIAYTKGGVSKYGGSYITKIYGREYTDKGEKVQKINGPNNRSTYTII